MDLRPHGGRQRGDLARSVDHGPAPYDDAPYNAPYNAPHKCVVATLRTWLFTDDHSLKERKADPRQLAPPTVARFRAAAAAVAARRRPIPRLPRRAPSLSSRHAHTREAFSASKAVCLCMSIGCHIS
eukprot:scaffold25020_cov75-Phaeocystis_antarctica.AAC.1